MVQVREGQSIDHSSKLSMFQFKALSVAHSITELNVKVQNLNRLQSHRTITTIYALPISTKAKHNLCF